MKKITLMAFVILFTQTTYAQPNITDVLHLSKSMVLVSTKISEAETGRGSGVVVSSEYVATNCHVIANTKGTSVSKYNKAYRPIAIKADWKHDLCLLKFENLPFPAAPLRDSSSLQYEEEIISLGYPGGFNVPQPSYGKIKGTYAYDGSNIIRTSAAFSLGSSGGALFDKDFNLIGISTFKSPGKRGYFYNLPIEWVKKLMASPETKSLHTNEVPFWALPLNQRPYFMQVVIPFQNQEWSQLKPIANQWTKEEPKSADAWFFLGSAEAGQGNIEIAKQYFNQALLINNRDLDAMLALVEIAVQQQDIQTLEQLQAQVNVLDQERGAQINKQIASLRQAG